MSAGKGVPWRRGAAGPDGIRPPVEEVKRHPLDAEIEIWTTPQVTAALQALTDSGFYGRNIEETAEQLLREKTRELLRAGHLKGWVSKETGR